MTSLEKSNFNIQGLPCADNAIDVLYYGRKLHIIFLEDNITILTDEPIKKKIKQIVDLQGFKKLIELEYEKAK